MKKTIIINRLQKFGTLNGVLTDNNTLRKEVNKALKLGTAKKQVDTNETLMYKIV